MSAQWVVDPGALAVRSHSIAVMDAETVKAVVNCTLTPGSTNRRMPAIRAIAVATTTGSHAASADRYLTVSPVCGDTVVTRDAIPVAVARVMEDVT